jgi:hypothetical protein
MTPGCRKFIQARYAASAGSLLIASLGVGATLACLLGGSPRLLHWFVIPVALCGVVVGRDAVEWIRGRVDLLDPGGLIGLVGIHFFFLTPLLLVLLDRGVEGWNVAPSDWRPWLGTMAFLNLFGLLIYHAILRRRYDVRWVRADRVVWKFDRKRFPLLLGAGFLFSTILQVEVYRQFGGIAGYLEAAGDLQRRAEIFQGFGFIFLLSESAPLVLAMGFALYAPRSRVMRTWPCLLSALLVFLLLQLFFGGLRGSRSATVWALFWVVGLVHLCIRQIPRKVIVLGFTFAVLPFMYFYGFFKAGGFEGVASALSGTEARARLEESSGRSWQSLILGDLSRSDMQALLLQRLTEPGTEAQYAWGGTYVASAALLIPRAVLPTRPDGKVRQATDLVFGRGAYASGIWASSKVYGLAGEAMLNFGPLAVPVSFVPLALLVRAIRRRRFEWRRARDSRMVILPMLVSLCVVMLVSDSDNVLFFLVKGGALPILVVFLSSVGKRSVLTRPSAQVSAPARLRHRDARACA